ncbi:S-protein homolog 6 [Linum perenne]
MNATWLPTVLVAVAAAALLAGTTSSSAFSLWPYKHVHVINELWKSNRHLYTHCWSKNDDMGSHEVGVGGEYTWRFRPSLLGTTKWTCNVHLNDGRNATWDTYWEDLGEGRRELKENIYWAAQEEGIFLRIKQESRDEIYAKWQ